MIELQFRFAKDGCRDSPSRQDAAFHAMKAAHEERLRRFCLRLCAGSAEDANDLLQETWLAAFKSLPRFQSRSKITTWLFRIAVFRWRQMRPAHQPLSEPDIEPEAIIDSSLPDTATSTINRIALEDALKTLPETLRESFLLVKAEQFTHREAAAILEIPQGTVQARVHEAVRRLRHLLNENEAE